MATPPSLRIFLTSRKSRLIVPRAVMISAILFVAVVSTSSTSRNPSVTFSLGNISMSRWLLMTSNASTCFEISMTPLSACFIFPVISNLKGMVTIPTVRIPIFFAISATTGAAPVPVPPPIPAVMNAIFVPSLKRRSISSRLSSAALRATTGSFPAPSPSVII